MKERFCDSCKEQMKSDDYYYDMMLSAKKSEPSQVNEVQDSIRNMSGIYCIHCIRSGKAIVHLSKWVTKVEK